MYNMWPIFFLITLALVHSFYLPVHADNLIENHKLLNGSLDYILKSNTIKTLVIIGRKSNFESGNVIFKRPDFHFSFKFQNIDRFAIKYNHIDLILRFNTFFL